MILDSLKNKAQYAALHPRFQAVFDFIDNNDVASLPCGRHDIDGDNIFVMVQELDLREVSAARLELHRKYIDIQLLLSGPNEIFGWSEKKDCLTAETEFDEQKDIQLFTDIPQCFYSVGEGQFSILFPEDGHAPMLGEGHVKKCIFKVAL
ncbi:MAG: YhcH/YjgK/YiaL family protein [Rikenellaceae bacterium]|jgi:YhcH/YjgK/YiaL family protein|nr:YhcH/YjgK/YiaL family protein [Alistipes sp.]MBQ6571640.1 YhcH/YjgK/YiaL family protein [Alistipes sp.]MDO5486985.1 YhcH/YjgK/YiaL family protein [Rikenellaceae bacterium]